MSRKARQPTQVAHVGIIFLVGDRVLIESTPADKGEVYGDFVNHARGHEEFWAQLQAQGLAPQNEDYLTAARGRSVVHRATGQSVLYLDRCIIKRSGLVREIKRRLQLPVHVEILTDQHYRCPVCLSRSPL